MKGNGKYLILLFSFVFSVSVTVLGWQHSKNQQKIVDNEVLAASEKEFTSTDQDATDALNALYLDDEHIYLAQSISDSTIDLATEKVNSLSDGSVKNNLLGNLTDVNKRWTLIKATNQLFDMPVISGNTVNSSVKLKSSTTKTDIDSVQTQINNSGINDEFTNSVKSIISLANDEYEDASVEATSSSTIATNSSSSSEDSELNKTAQSAIDKLVKNGTVVTEFTMDDYKNAKNTIDMLPSGEAKDEFLEKLALVQKRMSDMGLDYN